MIEITIKIAWPPVRSLLDDPELKKFKKLLADPAPGVKVFLDALDRPDVVLAMKLTPVSDIPGIVPALNTLRGNQAFEKAIAGNHYLKKCLGAVTKMRARSLGLITTGRKGRIGHWMAGFTVAEIYQATGAIWETLSFTPQLPKGATAFGIQK